MNLKNSTTSYGSVAMVMIIGCCWCWSFDSDGVAGGGNMMDDDNGNGASHAGGRDRVLLLVVVIVVVTNSG